MYFPPFTGSLRSTLSPECLSGDLPMLLFKMKVISQTIKYNEVNILVPRTVFTESPGGKSLQVRFLAQP